MALVVNDRVKETSTTTGTGTFDLAGAASGFQTFVAGVGDTNTTYYAIFNQGTTEWEVGLGTVTDAATDTLARTTVITSSNSGSAVDFASGTKDVFCTLPASKAVFGKQEGTNFTDSLLVGHSTTGTLSSALRNTIVGIDAGNAITSSTDSVAIGFDALGALNQGVLNVAVGSYALSGLTGTAAGNTAMGYKALYALPSGSKNVAIGFDTGKACDSAASWNTLIGTQNADSLTTGDGNVCIGAHAELASNTGDIQLTIGTYDGSSSLTWITGESTGNVEINETWNPSLSTTGKAFVMGF